jgi:superfamily II DNA or RNA helicase
MSDVDIEPSTPAQEPQRAPVLRPYQAAACDRIRAEIASGQRDLFVCPTGGGKTLVATALIEEAVRAGGRVVFLAHRRELIQQASAKLYDRGVDHGILLPGYPMRLDAPVQVASIPTLHMRGVRSRRIEMPPADLLVFDEAHHCPARTYRDIRKQYSGAAILGLTATPCRSDGRGLGDTFNAITEAPQIAELVELGSLVRHRVFAPHQLDLRGVHTARGDYVTSELDRRLNRRQLVGDITSTYLKHGQGRPTVVFACSVGHSVHIRNSLRAEGILAEHLDGTTPQDERQDILARLAAGKIDVVCNFGVLTEGWDCPPVACLINARPTKHMGLYRQMMGRGLRPAPGKDDLIILDHANGVFTHGFIDEAVIWTLDPDKRAENPHQTARQSGAEPRLVPCPECGGVRKQGQPCPSCGWRPRPKPVAVPVIEGELGQVDRDGTVAAPVEDRVRFHGELVYIGQRRGYKEGWAAHKYRDRYGYWPPRGPVEPLEPSLATLRWVTSELIRYAKGQQGAGR